MNAISPGLAHFADSVSASRLQQSIERTAAWLLEQQHENGYWIAELEGDTILESEYILLLAWLKQEHTEKARKCARYLLQQQMPEGGWNIFPGGPIEISASVKAYFALKLTGHDPASEPMQRARKAILAAGGADRVNSYTRFYLAMLGQLDYRYCPAVPPELVLLPRWFPVNLSMMSSWTRTIVVPLSILSALQPVTHVPAECGIRELFLKHPRHWPPLRPPGAAEDEKTFSWERFFRLTDRSFKLLQRRNLLPLRKRALKAAQRWMLDRFHNSDGLGAIFPPMVWSIIALRCLGYRDHQPELQYCYEKLQGLEIETEDHIRLEPCKSPVWDTAITVRALVDAGVAPDSRQLAAAQTWLVEQQILAPGDWSQTVSAEPGGWCFEFANEPYPDVDDTAMVLMALGESQAAHATPRGALRQAARDGSLGSGSQLLSLTSPSSIQRETVGDLEIIQSRFSGTCQAKQPPPSDNGFEHSRPASAEFSPLDKPPKIAAAAARLAGVGVRNLRETLSREALQTAVGNAARVWNRLRPGNGNGHAAPGGRQLPFAAQSATPGPANDTIAQAIARGEAWMLAMQNDDGGWGAFDRNNNREFLCRIPFADHNAMIDPSSPDITARVLEALASLGRSPDFPAIQRGLKYIRETQEADGSWFGRWGINYIYGTWQVLVGLNCVGVPVSDPAVQAGAAWLMSAQQPCGGWGETPASYDDPALKGQGPVTASQTAWALMGLMAAGRTDSPAVRRGIAYLLSTQLPDGTWDEPEYTGTGFPRVFYLKYHYYRIYFPLMALARYAQQTEQAPRQEGAAPSR